MQIGSRRVVVFDIDEGRLALARRMGADVTINTKEEGCMARAAVWAAFLRQDPALLAGLPDGLRSRSARLLTDLLAADLNALGETLAYLSARTALTIDYTTAAVAAARGGVQLTEEGMAAVCALLL